MKRRATPYLCAAACSGVFIVGVALAQAPLRDTVIHAPTRELAGRRVIGVNDLGRLLDATKYWRPDVQKLELRARGHRIVLTLDNPFVLVDEATVRLDGPVSSHAGELQIPVGFVDSLGRMEGWPRLAHDPSRQVVFVVPKGGIIRPPVVAAGRAGTRVEFVADATEDVRVVSRARARFRVRMKGLFAGVLPESFHQESLVHALRAIPSSHGSAFEFRVSSEAAGFRVIQDEQHGRVTIEFLREAGKDVEAFAPEGPPGPRRLEVVVIDPGHGGLDYGTRVTGAVEKDLTLELARQLREEITNRLPVHVVLTRETDREVSASARAEIANRAGADLVISVHFDGFDDPLARGATAFCPPATLEEQARPSGWALHEWREVALRHAVQSRELAEALLSGLELQGQGPTRLREIMPYPLIGVNAPGLLLECATLTSAEDRARVTSHDGLVTLAAIMADAIAAYERNE